VAGILRMACTGAAEGCLEDGNSTEYGQGKGMIGGSSETWRVEWLQGRKYRATTTIKRKCRTRTYCFLERANERKGKGKRTARSSETGCNLQLRTRGASALVGSEGHRRDDAPARWAAESHMP
jgi:hypothetical protein